MSSFFASDIAKVCYVSGEWGSHSESTQVCHNGWALLIE